MNAVRHYREGAVRVRLTGFSPERFFNLCGQGGVEIWKVSCDGREYEFHTTVRGFFSCRPFVRKSGVRLKILEKTGLPFFLYRNRKRKLWAAGFLLFFLLLGVLSLFVWDIELQGNLRHSDNELLHFLGTREITCGILKSGVDCEAVESLLRNEYPDITWVSARLEGTRLFVQIKENGAALQAPLQEETPADLVARADGEIVSMIVRSGTPLVAPGDAVEKGQVLVSGRIPITDDGGAVVSEYQVRADADIVAQTEYEEEKSVPVWYEKQVLTGRKRRGIFLQAFGKRLSLLAPDFKGRDWSWTVESRQARLTDTFLLPFFYGTISADEYVTYETRRTKEELSAMAEEYRAEEEAKLIEKGVQIIENNVTILDNGSACRFRLDMTLRIPAAASSPVAEEPAAGEEAEPPEGN